MSISNETPVDKYWLEIPVLTVFEAAYWMKIESDPRDHAERCACDDEYKEHYFERPGGDAAVHEKCLVIDGVIEVGTIKITKEVRLSNQRLDFDLTRINKSDWLDWCSKNGYAELAARFTPPSSARNTTLVITPTESVAKSELSQPWLVIDQRDPEPKQSWYTPARYFARQLAIDDPTLLTKMNKLADKVVQSLTKAGIKKRGGAKPFSSGTILKAFSNVNLG
jgi:hypothetical protein